MARKRAVGSGGEGRPSVHSQTGDESRQRRPRQGSDRAGASKRRDAGGEETALPAGLYLVSTPIGNAADITVRALQTLRAASIIACEDTRTTAKLLAIHGIARPLIAYHEHNADLAGSALVARVRAGEAVALVSDAGTPLVSDPGYRVVRACIAHGLAVVAIPGPSAVLAALTVSGLPTDRFLFAGFAPARRTARRRFLAELAGVPATLVLLEAPQRLADSLADMVAVFGEREAVVCRELTKLFEEIRRGPLADLAAHYTATGAPRGEVTLVIGPPQPSPALSEAEVDARLAEALCAGLTVRAAVDRVAEGSGWPRRAVYERALARHRDEAEADTETEDTKTP